LLYSVSGPQTTRTFVNLASLVTPTAAFVEIAFKVNLSQVTSTLNIFETSSDPNPIFTTTYEGQNSSSGWSSVTITTSNAVVLPFTNNGFYYTISSGAGTYSAYLVGYQENV
jgi:hypothetical protein